MGILGLDLMTLADMKLPPEKLQTLIAYQTSIQDTIEKFKKDFVSNPNLCLNCVLRSYMKSCLNWKVVMVSVEDIENYKGESISPLLTEFLMATYYSKVASKAEDHLIGFGSEYASMMNIKDKRIDYPRVFGLMMNMFIKKSLQKFLDKSVYIVYHLGVEPKHVSYLMGLFINDLMFSVEKFQHIFYEEELTGVVSICKASEESGISCNEPIMLEYSLDL